MMDDEAAATGDRSPIAARGTTADGGSAAGRRSSAAVQLARLDDDIAACRACPRLVAWREGIARTRVARFATEEYWGMPVPGFGDPEGRVLVLGLAPAAHGGNRTGRVFTGDRSGDVLFAALHRAGFASQPTSVRRGDGLALRDCRVAAAVRCAPPANRPTPEERDRCLPFLEREIAALARLRVIVALGAFGWDAALRALAGFGTTVRPRPRFGHGAEVRVAHGADARVGDLWLLGCYHPSQQNTFTGRVTPAMIDAVLGRATELAALPRDGSAVDGDGRRDGSAVDGDGRRDEAGGDGVGRRDGSAVGGDGRRDGGPHVG